MQLIRLLFLTCAMAGCDAAAPAPGQDSPAPEGSRLPGLAISPDGRALLSWVEPAAAGHRLVYATLTEGGWDTPVTVAQGADWFVNWADVPSVMPLHPDLWAAHWLIKQPGGMYAYDIAMAISEDAGRSWTEPFRPHQDGTPTEHGFVSLWPAVTGSGASAVGAVWLDGRHTLVDPAATTEHRSRMTLRSAVFDARGRKTGTQVVDEQVCDCCQTDVALTDTGPVVVYRDRNDGEVRDIHTAWQRNGNWQAAGPVAEDGWVITGCPVNGPAAAAADGHLAAAWYTEAAGTRHVRMARWEPARGGWSAAVEVADGTPLGRTDIAMLKDGQAAVSWLSAADPGHAWLLVARVDTTGRVGEALRVARTQASRPAGFPRLLRHGDELLLAWTRWRDEVPRVVVRRLALADLPAPA